MKRSFLVATLSLVSLTLASAQTQKRALTIEDFYRVQSVGSANISPDGAFVSYTIGLPIEEDNSTRTSTWVVATAGSAAPVRVQHYGQDVSGARWTDANRLQYTAEREQWTIDPRNPGPPVKLASSPRNAPAASEGRSGGPRAAGGNEPRIASPDGKFVAWAREKAQPRTQPAFASDFERRHEERFKGVQFDWKDFQRDGQPFPAPNPRARAAQQIVIAPASGGDAKVLTDADVRPASLAWHPDGTKLLFVADPDWRDELRYESPDLWMVTTSGNVTRLTNDDNVYSDPSFSPDGKYLAYVVDPGTDLIIREKRNHGGPSDLFIRPVDGGEAINLTASWDLEPGATRWSPDSRFIYFSAQVGGDSHLFRVSVPTGRVEQVTKGERRLNGISYDKGMTKIAYTVSLNDAPADVYVASIDGSGERKLTNVHAQLLSEIGFTRTERLTWASYDGTQIEGWLTYPHGYEASKGRYPLIVFSHGGPHSAVGPGFNFKKQFFAAHGYFILDTNFRSSTGYGEKFKWATWGAWGNKDGEDVVSGIDHVLKTYPIDAKRVGHTGHSYGGFMTNWLITQYPDRFAAAISGAGISNWISDYGTADIYRTKETEFFGTPWDAEARERMIKQSPLTYAGRVKTPTLFVHGEVDQRVPYEEAEQMYFALARRGVPTKMIQYADQPHGIGGHWNNVHRMLNELKWWDKYLKASAPSKSTSSGGI